MEAVEKEEGRSENQSSYKMASWEVNPRKSSYLTFFTASSYTGLCCWKKMFYIYIIYIQVLFFPDTVLSVGFFKDLWGLF